VLVHAGGQQSACACGHATVSLVRTCTSGVRSWSLSLAVIRYAEHLRDHTYTVHPPYISIGVVQHRRYTNDVTVAAQDASVVCSAAHYCQPRYTADSAHRMLPTYQRRHQACQVAYVYSQALMSCILPLAAAMHVDAHLRTRGSRPDTGPNYSSTLHRRKRSLVRLLEGVSSPL
jgi:hypothetical protein